MSDSSPSVPSVYEPDATHLDAWIRSLAGAVPWVGPALAELLTLRWTKVRGQRLKEAFDTLSRSVLALGEAKLDKAYVRSDDFMHILIVCLENVIREKDERKRGFFLNLLTNAMTVRMEAKRSRAEWLASVLGRMSEFHLVGFSLIVADADQRAALLREIAAQPGDFRAVAACLKDLESAGFIHEFHVLSGDQTDEARVELMVRAAQLTEGGKEFVEWVSTPPAPARPERASGKHPS